MKFFSLLKDKRFRYGTLSTVMMIVAVAVFVLVNLVATEFDNSWDLTAEQIYTLTPNSERFLAELDMDVTLYYVTRTGAETHLITQLMAEYAAASPRITTEVRDPMINPAFVHRFAAVAEGGIPNGSVIVETERGFRVITQRDMFPTDFFGRWGETFEAEREITQAIHALTEGELSVIYHITGSGELSLPPDFISFLELQNFEVREHNALIGEIPEDASIILITMPPRDWGEVKADHILDYLENRSGRAFFALAPTVERFPQLDRVLAAYGLILGNYLVLEANPNLIVRERNDWIQLPQTLWVPHEHITFPLLLNGFTRLFFTSPAGLERHPMPRARLEFEPLAMSSSTALGFPLDEHAEEIVEGPFYLAMAVTERDPFGNNEATQLVVVSNLGVLFGEINEAVGGANWAFVGNILSWLEDQPPPLFIPVRRPAGTQPPMISDAQAITTTVFVMGVLPLSIFGIGIFVWLRRRHS